MTTQRKFEIGGAIALFILLAIFAISWLRSREATVRAEAIASAQQQIVAAKDKDIATRDAQAAQYSTSLEKQAAAVVTPAQAAQIVVKYMPATAAQPIATVAKADLPDSVQKNLPDAPNYGILTGDQLQQVAKNELACDATNNTLVACKADVVDLNAVVAAKTTESKAWETAAKGGTKWQRFGRVMKNIGCAAGGAGIGALVNSKNPTGPAIGAGAGVAACSLF